MDGSRAESLRISVTLQINDLQLTGEWTPKGDLQWNGVPFTHLKRNFPDLSLLSDLCPDWLEQVYWPFVTDCEMALLECIERVLN